jgi:UDPglucose--hexose-1-phosphate uridylyltransferase
MLLELPNPAAAQVRVIPHFHALYRIEGNAERRPDGIYDCMRSVGAHEIVIESRAHGQSLALMSDDQIERVLQAYALRILDLKGDRRFKYITVFRNNGLLAGAEWDHPYSEIVATTFIPRRIHYELRSAREWYAQRERCTFCDILRQELKQARRIVDMEGDYLAFCPYASRVPFELWVMSRAPTRPSKNLATMPSGAIWPSCLGEFSGACSGSRSHTTLFCIPRRISFVKIQP